MKMHHLVYIAVLAIMAMVKVTEATNATNDNQEYHPKRYLGWYATRAKIIHLNPLYEPATPIRVYWHSVSVVTLLFDLTVN